MATSIRFTRAIRSGAAGAAIGCIPAIGHLALGLLSAETDAEWGRGAVAIGSLFLLAAFGGAGLVAGLLLGLTDTSDRVREFVGLTVGVTAGAIAGWVIGQLLENRFDFPDWILLAGPLAGVIVGWRAGTSLLAHRTK